ncbi:isoaspartyl peptidase/L-asparaginase family protein [Pontibacter silvestris]|uniref:Isoaspartyl peptidase/L-asparaginase family protein n=1 Tax=Pontibacter silvestris TaxID=2305183 RepID=A0ABW4X019_9BACT|nr:isoaspartyl peptidase/L-asparaginase [Pontibacter silvestris]MCC9135922.1 isoaspartyl peptidase/L-asparaginase [Pontibacter silvestris]
MEKFAIAIHAGAQNMDKKKVNPDKDRAYRNGLETALQAGWEILAKRGSAVDAVEAAVRSMEENPLFNAGIGSSLTKDGDIEFDAAIMEGKGLQAGAIGGVHYIQYPISLARIVMDTSKHTFLSGTGAEEYALKYNLPFRAPEYFKTDEKEEALQEELALKNEHDTVGAVALDQNGNLAAATSTGGLTGQLKGRIGDSPILGGGTYANNEVCAVSCTGDGEVIMRGVLAHEVYALVKYGNEDIRNAAQKAIEVYDKNLQGDKGLIAIDPKGNVSLAFNTTMMKRAYRINNGEMVVALWKEDKDGISN